MRRTLSVIGIAFGILASGCNRSDDKPIEIGHVHPVNQHDAEYKALQLAVEELNKDPSKLPKGRKLVLRHAPGGDTPDDWAAQATRLIALNKVQGLVGGDRWSAAEKIGNAVQGETVIALSPAGWAGPSPSQNLFTVGLAPEERGRVLALVAKAADKGKSAGVLVLRDPAAKAANVAADRFAADCRTFAPVSDLDVSVSKKPAAGVVFFACSARQAAQNRDAFKDALLFFGDEDVELAALVGEGPAAEGFQVATVYDPTNQPDRLAAFARRYQEAYKQSPTAAAVLVHDALTVWVEAVRRWADGARHADRFDAAEIRTQFLKRDKPFDVLTGTLIFADDHTTRRPVFVARIAAGKLGDIKTYEAGPTK